MNLTLWIAAGLLALIALVGGISKTFIPRAKLDAHPESWTQAPAPASSRPSGCWSCWQRWA